MNIDKLFRKLRAFTEEESPIPLESAAAILMTKDGSECIVYAGNKESVDEVLSKITEGQCSVSPGLSMKGKVRLAEMKREADEVDDAVRSIVESIMEAKLREKEAKEED